MTLHVKATLVARSHARARARAVRALRGAIPAAISFALWLGAGSASAQNQDADAERLFREGQKLMEERRFAEACPKFDAAYTKDRQLGTLINLAFCHKEQGALWYAWLEFREAEVKATELNRPDRVAFAKQRLAELEKALPKVILDVPPKLALSEVTLEDRKVWEAERGMVFTAEPGQRKIVFKAKGKKTTSKLIEVVNGTKVQHVTVPDMEDSEDTPLPIVVTPPDPSKGDPGAAREESPGKTQRTVGWIGIGVGGAALVVGIIEGILTLSSPCAGKKVEKDAKEGQCSSAEADSATTTGAISTVAVAVAVVGIGGGGVLLLTAPSASAPQPKAGSVASSQARIVVTPRIGAGWAGLSGTF